MQRDPRRIPYILDALRDIWQREPDLRLGQIVVNAIRPEAPCPEVFYAEDVDLLEGLREYTRLVHQHHAEETETTEVVAELVVEVALLPSAEQKRSGYRPNHKHPRTGEFFLGEVTFENGSVDPGGTARGRVRMLSSTDDLQSLLQFGSWSAWEANTHVASIRIIEVISRAPLKGAPDKFGPALGD